MSVNIPISNNGVNEGRSMRGVSITTVSSHSLCARVYVYVDV